MESSSGELGGVGKVGTIMEPLLGADGVGVADVPVFVSTVGSTFESVVASVSVAGVEPADGRTISMILTFVSEEVASEPSVAVSVVGLAAGSVGSVVGVSGVTSELGNVVGKGDGEVTAPVPVLGILEPEPVPVFSEAAARAAKL